MYHILRIPWWLRGKEPTCQAGDVGSSLGQEDPLEKELATHSSSSFCLENPMGTGAWRATVHGIATSQTQLSY